MWMWYHKTVVLNTMGSLLLYHLLKVFYTQTFVPLQMTSHKPYDIKWQETHKKKPPFLKLKIFGPLDLPKPFCMPTYTILRRDPISCVAMAHWHELHIIHNWAHTAIPRRDPICHAVYHKYSAPTCRLPTSDPFLRPHAEREPCATHRRSGPREIWDPQASDTAHNLSAETSKSLQQNPTSATTPLALLRTTPPPPP